MRTLLALVPFVFACDPTTTTPGTTPDPTDTDTTDPTPPVDATPTVEIAYPGMDGTEFYDGYDDALQLWYAEFTLDGSGTDPEDGALTGGSLVWTTDQTALQDAALGTGETPTVRLYSDDCFGVVHTLTLTGTDSAGNVATAVVDVFIYTVC